MYARMDLFGNFLDTRGKQRRDHVLEDFLALLRSMYAVEVGQRKTLCCVVTDESLLPAADAAADATGTSTDASKNDAIGAMSAADAVDAAAEAADCAAESFGEFFEKTEASLASELRVLDALRADAERKMSILEVPATIPSADRAVFGTNSSVGENAAPGTTSGMHWSTAAQMTSGNITSYRYGDELADATSGLFVDGDALSEGSTGASVVGRLLLSAGGGAPGGPSSILSRDVAAGSSDFLRTMLEDELRMQRNLQKLVSEMRDTDGKTLGTIDAILSRIGSNTSVVGNDSSLLVGNDTTTRTPGSDLEASWSSWSSWSESFPLNSSSTNSTSAGKAGHNLSAPAESADAVTPAEESGADSMTPGVVPSIPYAYHAGQLPARFLTRAYYPTSGGPSDSQKGVKYLQSHYDARARFLRVLYCECEDGFRRVAAPESEAAAQELKLVVEAKRHCWHDAFEAYPRVMTREKMITTEDDDANGEFNNHTNGELKDHTSRGFEFKDDLAFAWTPSDADFWIDVNGPDLVLVRTCPFGRPEACLTEGPERLHEVLARADDETLAEQLGLGNSTENSTSIQENDDDSLTTKRTAERTADAELLFFSPERGYFFSKRTAPSAAAVGGAHADTLSNMLELRESYGRVLHVAEHHPAAYKDVFTESTHSLTKEALFTVGFELSDLNAYSPWAAFARGEAVRLKKKQKRAAWRARLKSVEALLQRSRAEVERAQKNLAERTTSERTGSTSERTGTSGGTSEELQPVDSESDFGNFQSAAAEEVEAAAASVDAVSEQLRLLEQEKRLLDEEDSSSSASSKKTSSSEALAAADESSELDSSELDSSELELDELDELDSAPSFRDTASAAGRASYRGKWDFFADKRRVARERRALTRGVTLWDEGWSANEDDPGLVVPQEKENHEKSDPESTLEDQLTGSSYAFVALRERRDDRNKPLFERLPQDIVRELVPVGWRVLVFSEDLVCNGS